MERTTREVATKCCLHRWLHPVLQVPLLKSDRCNESHVVAAGRTCMCRPGMLGCMSNIPHSSGLLFVNDKQEQGLLTKCACASQTRQPLLDVGVCSLDRRGLV
jgi:hypothetical protein